MTPQQIIEIRERHNLSQGDLAALVGTTQAAVSRWESGGRRPRAVQLIRLDKLQRQKPSKR